MIDFNEQQPSKDESQSEQSDSTRKEGASCGSGTAPSQSWESCSCEYQHDRTAPTTPTELVFSDPAQPAQTETVFAPQAEFNAPAARMDAADPDQQALWEQLVRSQQPGQSPSGGFLPVTVARNPMQWTLVDLTSAGCGKPGCDPATCDAEDCDVTDAYDRSEYELPEYTVASGRAPVVSFSMDDAREFALEDGPSPAPAAFVPAPQEAAPKAEAVKPKKRAAGKKAAAKVTVTATEIQPADAQTPAVGTKRATVKKAAAKKAKAGGKKAAAKKTTAKKGAKKTTAKSASKSKAKKPAATKAKKAAAEKSSLPLPTNDPHFPRVQAA